MQFKRDPLSRYTEAFRPLAGTAPVSLADLPRHGCKWPVGEHPTLFCGLESATGRYCPAHEALSGKRLPVLA